MSHGNAGPLAADGVSAGAVAAISVARDFSLARRRREACNGEKSFLKINDRRMILKAYCPEFASAPAIFN